MERYKVFVLISVILIFPKFVFSQLTVNDVTVTNNKNCGCNYKGPKVVINEIMIKPAAYNVDGSIYDVISRLPAGGYSERGEWLELYNPDNCRWADLSYCFLGNDFYYVGHQSACFEFPGGTLIPPQGFVLIRGTSSPPVPSNLLVRNGGRTVEIVIDDSSFLNLIDYRLWLPNLGGWIAIYDKYGKPIDAVTWNAIGYEALNGQVFTPDVPGSFYKGSLASYNEIEGDKKTKISDSEPFSGKTYCRIPDGGSWDKNNPKFETYGTCNDSCVQIPITKCNGSAKITVSNGTPPYQFEWDDAFNTKSSIVTNLCPGTYFVTITDARGLTLNESIYIGQILPPLNLGKDTIYCNSFSRILNAGNPGSSYSWSTGETSQNIRISEGGNYNVVVETPNNCVLTDTIKIYHSFKPDLGKDTSLCENQYLALDAGPNYKSYNWSTGLFTRSIEPKNSGLYSVRVRDEFNCIKGDTIQVIFNPTPRIFLGNDTAYCKSQYMLDLGSGFSTYRWSDGSSGHSIIPETSGLYWVEVSNGHKCIKRDSIRITLNPLPGFDLGPDKTICEGDSLIADVGDNFKNYSWSTGSNERLVYLKKTDKYYVTVQNNFNCTKTDSIALNFFPKTEITNIDTSINGQIIIEGNLINLPYQFSIDQNNYQDNNTFTHLKPGKYTITIKDIHNCLATGYIDIYTDLITIPNYFTPNADGYHDTWEIKGISSYPYAKIQIFDRFGKLLVSYLGKDQAWDGTSGSIPLKSDDYWYSIDLGEGAKPYIGNLSLKR